MAPTITDTLFDHLRHRMYRKIILSVNINSIQCNVYIHILFPNPRNQLSSLIFMSSEQMTTFFHAFSEKAFFSS